jgi:hypothetical protein
MPRENSYLKNISIVTLSIMLGSVTFISSCHPKTPSSQADQKNLRSSQVDRCVALRGNGTHAVAHVMSLARMTTEWGEIQGFAGGSSATITSFLYESILLNPALPPNAGPPRNEAIAMLLKSIVGYMNETMQSPEWAALKVIGSMGAKISEKGILALPPSDYAKAARDLTVVLSAEDLRGLVNPEILGMLANASEPKFKDHQTKVEEVKKAAASLTNLDASDPDVFFRPGVLEFSNFIEMIGRVADFYAAHGVDPNRFSRFVRDCAPGTADLLWSEIALKKTNGGTCGGLLSEMVRDWRAAPTYRSGQRLSNAPGLAIPTIMITSVVQAPSALKALGDYDNLYHQGASRSLGLNFQDVKFGYWISKGFPADTIDRWNTASADGKSRKAVSLGEARTWREILEKSPREPSLGKFLPFTKEEPAAGSVSLGGWADLHPVQVLKAAGCGKVVYLTRRTPETTFISAGKPFEGRKPSGLAELLGMTANDYDAIYNLDNPQSAYARALVQADGVWCTNWNQFSALEQDGIAMDAWKSPLITKDSELSKWRMATAPRTPIVGCY